MKSRITKTAALAALMAGASGAANATEGWYGRVDVGYSVDGELDGSITDGVTEATGSIDFDSDWMGAVALGLAFQNGFRAEGEIAYRYNEWGPEFIPDPVDTDATGHARAWSAMANLFYDFNRGGSIEPYLGIGVGGARVDAAANGGAEGGDNVVAYQAMAGVAFSITEQLDVDVGYRYFAAPDVDLTEAFGPGLEAEADYQHSAVTIGLRYQFTAPAPPPPPPPPPAPPPPPPPPPAATCPTSEFVVYFEWDRSNLNQAALETIDAAVNRARECNIGGVVVVGHTDTSGSTAYNQGLSERRASVVRDALVARGISATSITAEARGESDLARATADGVREPLNRRTAVTISFR
jgi:outer membrane protein OmpA-like peptidoglycan-associated protein